MLLVLGEAGIGWIPYVLEHMDLEWEEQYQDLTLSMRPSEYWHRNCRATYQTDSVGLKMLDDLGEDNVMWGSDFPHPDGVWPDSKGARRRPGHRPAQNHLLECCQALRIPPLKVKIGIRVPSPELGVELDPAFVACVAEELGFESIWYPEHTILPVSTQARYTWSAGTGGEEIPQAYSAFVDPFIALAHASAATTKLKLGSGVTLIPERNPLLLAKEVATLDRFSGGRLLLGIGAGWIAEQSSILGADFPRRWRQTREAVHAMKALWTQDEPEFHGEYYDFPPVRCDPKPHQKPHPPILIGGESKHAFRRVVEWGDGWMPADVAPSVVEQGRTELDRLADQAGRNPSTLEVTAYFVEPRREAVKAMFDAGADRVVVRRLVTVNSEEEMAHDLERIAGNLF